jgi:alkanesulfonate monooxygenase SsuD/methylene tetrahydromethanopterin reductase-like flavin-dependent oxidoreductase (luciferase family)
MPVEGSPLRRLGFLTIGSFDPADPGPGHETTLQVVELGEELGFDSAWLRHRHLQPGISSPIAVLAALTQRTSRIHLGTAVTPLGWENPLRLAEDFATVDVLSHGRVNPGVSVGPPMQFEHVKNSLYPDTAHVEDFSYERVLRFHRFLRGDKASDFAGVQGIEVFSDRVEPHSPGLADRLWYGGASLTSAQWAGGRGLNLLASSVVRAEGESTDFASVQASHLRAFAELHPSGRTSQGLVVIPTDSASPAQVEKYRDYVEHRSARVGIPQGPGRLLFAQDLLGPSTEIAERLWADAGFQLVDEVVFALPFGFEHEDYVQILTDMARHLGPALGWSPAP